MPGGVGPGSNLRRPYRLGRREAIIDSVPQARDPEWVGKTFFARFDPKATWLDDLKPAFGEAKFFFEDGLQRIEQTAAASAQN